MVLSWGLNDEVKEEPPPAVDRVSPTVSDDGGVGVSPTEVSPTFDPPPAVDDQTGGVGAESPLTHDEQKLMFILGGTILGTFVIWALK